MFVHEHGSSFELVYIYAWYSSAAHAKATESRLRYS